MATWDVKNFGPVEVSTSPEFPDYEIHHEWGTDYYYAFSPGGMLGEVGKFADAVKLIDEHAKNRRTDMEKIPEAVIVSTDTGHVVSNDMAGNPLTVEEANALAREYNDACKPEHRTAKVFKLVPVEASWSQPAWLHERNNDPYGTPNNHPFWETVVFEKIGHCKVFARGGWAYVYDTRHNSWWHLDSMDKAHELAIAGPIDPWA
jgi:hypothetical protein